MRKLALLALLLAGCGSSPVAPVPVPTPIPYPPMSGGWSGVQSDTWVSADGSVTGARTCNETWLITSQVANSFTGNFQRTPGSDDACARSGDIVGTAETDGTFSLEYRNVGAGGDCVAIPAGSYAFRGVVSAAGNVTAGVIFPILRCPYGRGTIDFRFTRSVVMTRR